MAIDWKNNPHLRAKLVSEVDKREAEFKNSECYNPGPKQRAFDSVAHDSKQLFGAPISCSAVSTAYYAFKAGKVTVYTRNRTPQGASRNDGNSNQFSDRILGALRTLIGNYPNPSDDEAHTFFIAAEALLSV